MKLCPSCEQRLFDEIARAVKGNNEFWPEELLAPLAGYGPEIDEDVFLAAMAERGWLNCKECQLWVHSVDKEGLCVDCEEGEMPCHTGE